MNQAAEQLRRHARRRSLQRLGRPLNRNLRGEIVSQILGGRGLFLGIGNTAMRTKWLVLIGGRAVKVVYDERERELCTLIPLGLRASQRLAKAAR
jgi:hypothetical protein